MATGEMPKIMASNKVVKRCFISVKFGQIYNNFDMAGIGVKKKTLPSFFSEVESEVETAR